MSYYTLQRTKESYAAAVFENLFESASARRAAAKLTADVLRAAGETTSAWSVTLDTDSVRVNVGPVRLFVLASERTWFCATKSFGSSLPEGITAVRGTSPVYASVPVPSRSYAVSSEALKRIPRGLRRALLDYVAEAGARRSGKSLYQKSNSPGIMRFLESYLGIDLPRPLNDSDLDDLASSADLGGETFEEGAAYRVNVNRYERSRTARAACIAEYGDQCFACGMDMGTRYGEQARGYIQVHHLTPVSEMGGDAYQVDAKRDLRPLCPNCHVVLHLPGNVLTVDDLRARFRRARRSTTRRV